MLDAEYKMHDEEIMVDVEIILLYPIYHILRPFLFYRFFFFKNRFYNMYCLYNSDLKTVTKVVIFFPLFAEKKGKMNYYLLQFTF